MPRPNKIWFRKDVGWWMVTISGKRIRLAEGRENKKLAQQKFHELAVERARAPEAPTGRSVSEENNGRVRRPRLGRH